VDVRIVAATNRDLERAVAQGQFREDLFFRLNVVCIQLPPLRDRREEIPLLSEYFLKKYSVQYNKPYPGIAPETLRLFMEYDWPGNVRELENLIKRTVVLGTEAPIQKELLHAVTVTPARVATPPAAPLPRAVPVAVAADRSMPAAASPPPRPSTPPVSPPAPAPPASYSLKEISKNAAREAERELILQTLQHTRWNRKETAEILGISYKALLYKIKENGLDRAS
jgi:two-component system, NtrC family, response regulator AtoC